MPFGNWHFVNDLINGVVVILHHLNRVVFAGLDEEFELIGRYSKRLDGVQRRVTMLFYRVDGEFDVLVGRSVGVTGGSGDFTAHFARNWVGGLCGLKLNV